MQANSNGTMAGYSNLAWRHLPACEVDSPPAKRRPTANHSVKHARVPAIVGQAEVFRACTHKHPRQRVVGAGYHIGRAGSVVLPEPKLPDLPWYKTNLVRIEGDLANVQYN